jgi:hypothetical protein
MNEKRAQKNTAEAEISYIMKFKKTCDNLQKLTFWPSVL